MVDRLDILIFGATGFTGMHCIPYVAKLSKENGRQLTWGVAGRSEEKLREVLKKMAVKAESNFDNVPVVIADIKSQDSLVSMAKRTRLLINCVGPYRFHGDAVVKACIEAGTHHVDVSGEPEYMERVQLEQHDDAVQKGIYVISACGLDSIPADMGVLYLQQNFEGTLHSVETYLKAWLEGSTGGLKGVVNYGTWDSLVHSLANRDELKIIRKRFYEKYKKAPSFPPKLKIKSLPHKHALLDEWVLPFMGADSAVIRRTQNYLYEYENRRPAQIGTYFTVPSICGVISLLLFAVIFFLLSKFKFGRKLLLDYPEIFTYGFVSKKQPSEEVIENTWFSIDFEGKGWKEKLANKDDQYQTPMDSIIRAKIKAKNPGYGFTCLALVLSGIVLLTETDKLANNGKGGVFTPGAAFAKTSLIKQLEENGVLFEITPRQDI